MVRKEILLQGFAAAAGAGAPLGSAAALSPVQSNENQEVHEEMSQDALVTPTKYADNTKSVESRVEELNLLEDNWDAQGAIAPGEQTIVNLKNCLSAIDVELEPYVIGEDIVPSFHGTVTLYIEISEDNRIELEIGTARAGVISSIGGRLEIVNDIPINELNEVLRAKSNALVDTITV